MKKISIAILVIIVIISIVGAIFVIKKKNNDTIAIEYNYYKYYSNEKFGVIDKSGNVLIEAKYSDVIIPNPTYDVFFLLEDNVIKNIVNEKEEPIFTKYNKVMPISVNGLIGEIPYEKEVLVYTESEKLGLLDLEGKEITQSLYTNIESVPYKEGELLCVNDTETVVLDKNGKEKIKLEKGIEIISDGYSDENYSTEKAGYIVSKQTDKGILYGYINYKGKEILGFEYDEIKRIKNVDEYLIAKKNGQYGLFKNGKPIINSNYQDMKYNENLNMLFVKRTNNVGVLNLKGEVIVPVEYVSAEEKGIFIETINQDKEIKRFDLQGNEINYFDKYNSVEKSKFDDTYIAITNEYIYQILDNNYNSLTTEKYEYIENILDDIYIIKDTSGKYGVLNITGQKIIQNQYDVIQLINSSEVIQVMDVKQNITALFDKNGNKFFEEKDALIIFENEYIKVFCNEGVKYFTLDGKETSSEVIYKNNNILGFFENGKWGFKDRNGNIVLEAKYDRISEVNKSGFGGIKIGGNWGIIDSNGRIIVEPKFYIDDDMSEPEFLNKFYKSYYASAGAFYIE